MMFESRQERKVHFNLRLLRSKRKGLRRRFKAGICHTDAVLARDQARELRCVIFIGPTEQELMHTLRGDLSAYDRHPRFSMNFDHNTGSLLRKCNRGQ
jgi:hypothetical protein